MQGVSERKSEAYRFGGFTNNLAKSRLKETGLPATGKKYYLLTYKEKPLKNHQPRYTDRYFFCH